MSPGRPTWEEGGLGFQLRLGDGALEGARALVQEALAGPALLDASFGTLLWGHLLAGTSVDVLVSLDARTGQAREPGGTHETLSSALFQAVSALGGRPLALAAAVLGDRATPSQIEEAWVALDEARTDGLVQHIGRDGRAWPLGGSNGAWEFALLDGPAGRRTVMGDVLRVSIVPVMSASDVREARRSWRGVGQEV